MRSTARRKLVTTSWTLVVIVGLDVDVDLPSSWRDGARPDGVYVASDAASDHADASHGDEDALDL